MTRIYKNSSSQPTGRLPSAKKASESPDILESASRIEINKAAVIGAGAMGVGIAMNFINAGVPVVLIERGRKLLERGLDIIRANYERRVSGGKISPDEAKQRMSLIASSLSVEDAADVDIVVEAVFENMGLKKEIFRKLDAVCKKNAILATNTSYLDVNEIAAATKRPESVLGLHFFNPANVMRLLEVVRAAKTSKSVLDASLSLAEKMKKVAVVVGVCHGFAGNRMYSRRKSESINLILEGASPLRVDKTLRDFGFPMGPFALFDLTGNDLGWSKETSTGSTIQEKLCEAGRFGLKSGLGYYKYEEGSRKPIRDPEVDRLIIRFSEEKKIKRRVVSDEEILKRCLYPIINEGAKILEEGVASRPGDLDTIWALGYGWPSSSGGPTRYADMTGLGEILKTLREFRQKFGEFWKPAAMLEKLASENKGFKDL